MRTRHHHHRILGISCTGLAVALAAGCGSGGGDSAPAPAPAPSAVELTTTVLDGAIRNALVCLDANANGACDSGELQGRTGADGKVTLSVPAADAGRFALLALVGTDAVDADHGPVTTAYTMQAPADQTAVVSPLSTLVQRVVADSGVSSATAASAVQSALGLAASLFANYQATGGSAEAATVARLLVVTQQQQLQALASALNTNAIDGQPITTTDLQTLVQRKLVEMAQPLAAAAGDPAVAAATGEAKAAAIAAAAAQLVATEGITAAGAPVAVAAGRQAPSTPSTTPEASVQLVSLSFTDGQNWSLRALTSSVAQATPDSDNKTRFVDRRMRKVAGNLGTWSSGSDPTRNSDVHWNGSAWVTCGMNFENKSTVRTAAGLAQYDYCGGRETGSSQRSTFDVAGQSMATVLQQARDAGYTNLAVAGGALGDATFPAGSKVHYHASTPTTTAFTYLNGGAEAPAGTSNRVTQYSAAVADGGTASQQPAGTACNAPETNTSGVNSTTLESMIAVKHGTPCSFNPGTFVYQGVTYSSGDRNEWWGNSTVNLGKLGSAPVGSGTAPGYYTTNTLLRVGFAASGNGVTYYACQERFSNGSPRNCNPIGTGTYTIQTLGDARVLSFANLPAQTAGLTYERVLVERGGAVFFGFRSKPVASNSFRLNGAATAAFLAQLGLPAIDPAVPFATTAGSFVGTWDLRDPVNDPVGGSVTAVTIGANGAVSCFDREQNQSFACAVTFSNVATGAYTWTAGESSATGTFDHVAASTSGSYIDPTGTPTSGNFIGTRR